VSKPAGGQVVSATPPATAEADEAKAGLLLHPNVKAAILIQAAYSNTKTMIDPLLLKDGAPDEVHFIRPLLDRMKAVSSDGDMKGLEEMLVAQAYSLDALFFRLATYGMRQTERPNLLAVMGLAIRAQGACRSTIETLSAVKNPPAVAFVRQANIAGVQQVNNEQPVIAPASVNAISPNKLMEVPAFGTKRLDAGAPAADAGDDSPVVPLEVLSRAPDPGGEGTGGSQRLQGWPPSEPTPTRSRSPRVRQRAELAAQPGETMTPAPRAGGRRPPHGS
jgi:hypothetical protein